MIKYLHVRWVVESANGRLKRWRYLDRTVPNTQIPDVGDYVRIISAICNKYTPPLSYVETEEEIAIAAKIVYLYRQPNELRIFRLKPMESIDDRLHGENLTPQVWLQSSLNCLQKKFVRNGQVLY